MNLLRKLMPLLLIAVFVVGCGGGTSTGLLPQTEEDYGDTSTTGGASQHRNWTVLMYVDAANNLWGNAIDNINQMELVGSNAQVAILLQVKGVSEDSYEYSTDTRRYYIAGDTDMSVIESTVVEDLGSGVDMASPDTLADFIEWGKAAYPADHYAIVLWDHGQGWEGVRAVDQPPVKAIFIDDETGNEMSLAELQDAFAAGGDVDVAIFDACLMSMLEVGYSIKDYADIMVASEETIWASGMPYELYLLELRKDPYMSPNAFSEVLVDTYAEAYADWPYVTISAVDLSTMNQLAAATSAFGQSMINNIVTIQSQVESAQANAQEFGGSPSTYKDLYHFASLVNSSVSVSSVKTAAQNVMNQISNSVMYEWHVNSTNANSHGISIYIPPSGGFNSDYLILDFADETSWDEFLSTY